MTRKIIEDIVPRSASIRYQRDEDIEEGIDNYRGHKRSAWSPIFFILVGTVLVLVGFLIFSSIYSRASVKVATTKNIINLDDLIFLNTDGAGGGVKYDLMKFKDVESVSVPITGSKTVLKSATGVVTIYNAYSSAPQKLVIGTRLETKDGKIFKIDKAIVVPGTSVAGGKTIPGSVNISVKAAMAGASYNIPPSDFTIPGFKGSPRYQKFYAKSSKPISGGFSGEIKTTSSSDLKQARLKAEETLRQRLMKDALLQVPDGLLLYEDGIFITFTDNVIDGNSLAGLDGEDVKLQMTGELNAVMVNQNDLESFIISMKLADLDKDAKVIILDLDKINFEIINKDKVILDGNVMVKITGDTTAVRDFDENMLKEKLKGIKISRYQDVFKDFPVIEKAEATFSPSWALYFPNDTTRIELDKGF